jgi:hypothetical protein
MFVGEDDDPFGVRVFERVDRLVLISNDRESPLFCQEINEHLAPSLRLALPGGT